MYRNGDQCSPTGSVFPRTVHFELPSSDARAHVVCIFFSVYLFVLFLRGASSLPYRSDPISLSLSAVRAYISCPSTAPPTPPHPILIPVTHYTSPTPAFSPATRPTLVPPSTVRHTLAAPVTLSNTMTKTTHARGHIYSLAEVAKRESLLSFTHYCRLTPV